MNGPIPSPLPNPLTGTGSVEQSTATSDMVAVDHVIFDCSQVLADVDTTIKRAINDCLNVCHADVRFCHACIMGAIQKEQSLAATVLDKCWEKINRQLVNHVGEAFKAAQVLGIPLPAPEQLAAALAGQDIPDINPSNTVDTDDVAGGLAGVFDAQTAAAVQDALANVAATSDATGGAPAPICPPGTIARGDGSCVTPGGGPPQGGVCPPLTAQTAAGLSMVTDFAVCPDQFVCLPDGTVRMDHFVRVDRPGCPPFCLPSTSEILPPDEAAQAIANGLCTPPSGGGGGGGGGPPICPPCPPQQPCPPDIPPLPPAPDFPQTSNPLEGICSATDFSWYDIFKQVSNASFNDILKKGSFFSYTPTTDTKNKSWLDVLKDPGGLLVSALFKLGDELAKRIGGSVGASVEAFLDPLCNTSERKIADAALAARSIFGNWFGLVPGRVTGVWQYVDNLACQWRLPETIEGLNAYARGYFTKEQFEYITKANADCLDWQYVLLEARRTRIGIQDAYRLFKLGNIDEDEFVEAWKRQGVDVEKERELFEGTIKQYPGPADLIRMMVRDVEDKDVQKLLGLDIDFGKKWIGNLKKWGEAQGISDEVALNFWRAHWQQPSPGQVFEWFHRLRPDDRDPDDPNANIVVDKETVRELLQIADYVPGLVDNYLATSYRPIGRRDIVRLYRLGAIRDVDGIRRAFRDVGLSDLDAGRMAEATVRSESVAKAKLAGELAEAEIFRGYRNDTITEAEARRLLVRLGYESTDVDTRIGTANLQRQSQSRATQLKSLRTRYFYGEFTDSQAETEVNNVVPSPEQATRIVSLWKAERAARRKYPTIATLCKWFDKGLIDLAQYMERVRNLNYSESDAFRVVEACQIGIRERQFKELEKEKAKQDKAAQKAARQVAAALREQKRLARQQMLMHKRTHKAVTRNKDGTFTTTITDTFTDTDPINVTNTSERINITTGNGTPKP